MKAAILFLIIGVSLAHYYPWPPFPVPIDHPGSYLAPWNPGSYFNPPPIRMVDPLSINYNRIPPNSKDDNVPEVRVTFQHHVTYMSQLIRRFF